METVRTCTARLCAAALLIAICALPALAAEPFKVTMMTSAYSTDPVKPDSEAMKQVEAYVGADLDITFVPATGTNYADKFNLTLASGNIPMVILSLDRGASVFKAIRQGAFWDIGPYLKDYPNLKQANPIALWNSSFEGKYYGLYRARPLGRNGVIYRSDWLKSVGLKEPKTIDEFYTMLKAFTLKDPDKNGKQDTYGMVLTQYMGPFDQMVTWFGGPNGWGEDPATKKLVPAFMTAEYMATLKFFKKLFDEKLINEDFAVFPAAKWNDPIMAGKAGVAIDVTDRSNKINQEFELNVPGAYMDIMSPPAGPKGQRSLATAGFAGVFLFSKTSIKDVDTLKKVLAVMDKLGDKKMQDLCGYGIEGRHYTLVDGFILPKPLDDTSFQRNEINDLNQILTLFPPIGTPQVQKPWIAKGAAVQLYNEKIAVGNPVAPFVSNTYGQKGAQLDNLINDSRIKYIIGQIDDKGWQDAIDAWKKTGGDDIIKEYNEDYAKFGVKK